MTGSPAVLSILRHSPPAAPMLTPLGSTTKGSPKVPNSAAQVQNSEGPPLRRLLQPPRFHHDGLPCGATKPHGPEVPP